MFRKSPAEGLEKRKNKVAEVIAIASRNGVNACDGVVAALAAEAELTVRAVGPTAVAGLQYLAGH